MNNRMMQQSGMASETTNSGMKRKDTVRMKTAYRMIVAVVGMLVLVAGAARGATWQNGSGDWNDSNTVNWNPASVPTTGTAINLTQSSAGDINITYSATSQTGTELVTGNRYGAMSLNNAGGGTTTLFIDSNDLLPCGSGNTDFTIGTGGKLDVAGGRLTPESNFRQTGGAVVQSGGLIQPHNYDLLMSGGTYTLGGGTSSCRIATINPSSGTATINQSGGFFLTPSAQSVNLSLTPSGTGQVVYNQTDGTNAVGGINGYRAVSISGNATYSLSGANSFLQAGNFAMSGGAFTQSSGTAVLNFQVDVQGGAQMSVSGGTIKMNLLKIGTAGTSGTVTLTGGNCFYAIGNSGGGLQIGGATGSGMMIIKGCTVSGNASADSSITIGVTGAMRGYGTIANGLFDPVSNSGQVIADGDGVDRTLDLSSFNGSGNGSGSVLNPTENTSSNGWFATNHGKLTLPTLPIAAGTSTTNWGEAATDTAIDLVNSASLALTGVASAATLTGSLLALDRADVTTIPAPAVGMSVHDFSLNKTFTSAILTIRYNHLAVPSVSEGQVRLYWYNGSTWVDKTASLDTVNRTVTSVSLTALGKFAVVYKIRGTVIEVY